MLALPAVLLLLDLVPRALDVWRGLAVLDDLGIPPVREPEPALQFPDPPLLLPLLPDLLRGGDLLRLHGFDPGSPGKLVIKEYTRSNQYSDLH